VISWSVMAVHLHIDPFSGIAGDMFLGALVDLGASAADITSAMAPLPIGGKFELATCRAQRGGIEAVDLKVHPRPRSIPRTGPGKHESANHSHGHAHYRDIVAMIDQLDTTDRARGRARRVVDALAHAEARVHGEPVEQLHFHEVGAIDSVVDILGSVIGMELLAVNTVSCGPLPISRGFVRCEHGRLPVPAPATAYLMQGMAAVGVDRVGELVTPTGAAIIAGVCDAFGPMPPLTLQGVGYGAGDRDDPDAPNVLRLFLGERG